jgi:hypothetical protein
MESHSATEPFSTDASDQSTLFSFSLEDDDLRSEQLGHHTYRNYNESHPRGLVTARHEGGYYFHARCRRPIHGSYNSLDQQTSSVSAIDAPKHVSAALIVLDFSFQQRASSRSRFKMAEIELEFYDAATVLLNPHESGAEIDITQVPTVLHFEPQQFEGPVASAVGQTGHALGISVSDPTNMFSFNPSISRTTPFVVESSFKVHGVLENDPPSKIHWVMREDKLKKNGIRPEVSIAAIVKYVPGRKFAARVRIRADVALRFVRPVAGAKDDPLYFEAGEDEGKDSVLPRDLRGLTRLDAYGGMWPAEYRA